jgi:hypothetical protein
MLHERIVRRLLTLAVLLAATTSCGDAVRNGSSAVYLTVMSFQAAPGGGHNAGTFSDTLLSDVQVLVTTPAPCTPTSPCPTVFDDSGRITLVLTPKNTLVAPTTNNQVTITRYHVDFSRADGLNTPGVYVPYGFDGAVTTTVPTGSTGAIITFELVRHVAKEEPPLAQLVPVTFGTVQINGVIINTIATVTLYGTDQVGNALSVSASMSVEFGNFGD